MPASSIKWWLAGASVCVVLVAALGLWLRTSDGPPSACDFETSYEVRWTSKRDPTTGIQLPVENQQEIVSVVRLIPVADRLHKVSVESPRFVGYPAELQKQMQYTLRGKPFFLEANADKPPSLWIASKTDVSDNVVKLLLSPWNVAPLIPQGKSRRTEADRVGTVVAEYERSGNRVNRKRIHYSAVPSGPLPAVRDSREEFVFDPAGIKSAKIHSVLFFSLGDGGGGSLLVNEDITLERIARTPITNPDQCKTLSAKEYTGQNLLTQTDFLLMFDPGKQAPKEPRSVQTLVSSLSKAKKPMSVLQEITDEIERDPSKTWEVTKILEISLNDEEKTAQLLSVLGHAKTEEAQRALRELMELYRKTAKERLLIHAIRHQQFGEYIVRANVENLMEYSRDTSLPPRVRQAALMATGTTAAKLGDEPLIERYRERWESDFTESRQELPKVEALSALGNLADRKSFEFLKPIAASDKGVVGNQAIEAMRLIKEDAVKEYLLNEAKTSEAKERRQNAFDALGFTPASEKMCLSLIAHFNSLLAQFGNSRQQDRMQILAILSRSENLRYPSVRDFFKTTLSREERLTAQEKEARDQTLTLF